jgi:hypothetical protein
VIVALVDDVVGEFRYELTSVVLDGFYFVIQGLDHGLVIVNVDGLARAFSVLLVFSLRVIDVDGLFQTLLVLLGIRTDVFAGCPRAGRDCRLLSDLRCLNLEHGFVSRQVEE